MKSTSKLFRIIILSIAGAAILFAGNSVPLSAGVVRLEIIDRGAFAGGHPFGAAGPYEFLKGRVHYTIDPANPLNRRVVDLGYAPRNADGMVEYRADFYILKPVDIARGNGALLYDVNNRGGKLALRFFNDANTSNSPQTLDDAGNGFLMREGYTVVWNGWLGDLEPGGDRLLLEAPIARKGNEPITGTVRAEISTDSAQECIYLSPRTGQTSYQPVSLDQPDAVMTCRIYERDTRVIVPREKWRFARVVTDQSGEKRIIPDGSYVTLEGRFQPGYLYEVIYEVKDPLVLGLGFTGVRDLVSFLKYERQDKSGNPNPFLKKDGDVVSNGVKWAYSFGVSQSGRFLRHFLYEGFNEDLSRRKVFDAIWPHVAGGGRGFFNHRFAQTSRFSTQHAGHSYPGDMFPFTYGDSEDPFTGERDGILRRARQSGTEPLVIHTVSATEYYERAASLVHTDPLGNEDVPLPENVRMYLFSGTQHGPAPYPPQRGGARFMNNPADYRPFLRALLYHLDRWVKAGEEPPASVYPVLKENSLVSREQAARMFPRIPGVPFPALVNQPSLLNFGPQFRESGILTVHPPERVNDYRVLIPAVDGDGNEPGGLRLPEVEIPVATYTGWNLRSSEIGAENALMAITGSFLPLPLDAGERTQTGDPRVSLLERYENVNNYVLLFRNSLLNLVRRGYILPEDIPGQLNIAERYRMFFNQK